MTIRFAPARHRDALSRTVAWGAKGFHRLHPANENEASADDQALLIETLRHFAVHGFGAAERASRMAVIAAQANDDIACDRWTSICGMLDKRMARKLANDLEFTASDSA